MSLPSPRFPQSEKLRWTLLGSLAAAVVGAPFAIGQDTEKVSVVTGTRTPISGEVLKPTTLATDVANHGLAVTNDSNRGAAALLTCRATTGDNRRACLTAVNLRSGRAFQFTFRGALGGLIQVGNDIDKPFPEVQPFRTNATGVATGLNSDRVDGLHAQDIIDEAVSRSSVQVGPQGPQGAQGAQGTRGPQGLQGPSGPPGTPLDEVALTPANAGFGGRRVVELDNVLLTSTAPDAANRGEDLLPGISISLEPGTYIIQTTFRAFDASNIGAGSPVQYGVATVFLDGTPQTTMWTPDIPSIGNGNNAAVVSDTTVVSVGSGPTSGNVTVEGVVRNNTGAIAGSTAQGGVTVIVTEVNAS